MTITDKDRQSFILTEIVFAETPECLRMMGEVLRLKKQYREPFVTEDFLNRARKAYLQRKEELENESVRQQSQGDSGSQRLQEEGEPAGLHGEVRDRGQAVLDLGLGEGVEERGEGIS